MMQQEWSERDRQLLDQTKAEASDNLAKDSTLDRE